MNHILGAIQMYNLVKLITILFFFFFLSLCFFKLKSTRLSISQFANPHRYKAAMLHPFNTALNIENALLPQKDLNCHSVGLSVVMKSHRNVNHHNALSQLVP